MKCKTIILPNKDYFINLMASQFQVYAESELSLIKVFIKFDMFNGFHLDKHTRERIRRELNVPYSTLTTSLRKLVKQNIISRDGRNGKTMYFNVGFRSLNEIDAIVFKAK